MNNVTKLRQYSPEKCKSAVEYLIEQMNIVHHEFNNPASNSAFDLLHVLEDARDELSNIDESTEA